MRKILFLVLLLIISLQSICFAEDVYIGDNKSIATYLRTESINADMRTTQGYAISTIVITYTIIGIPEPDKLSELKKLCLDNDITYTKQSFEVLLHYDRIKNKFSDEIPYVTMKDSTLNDKDGKKLFTERNIPKFVCALNSEDPKHTIHKSVYKNVIKYLKEHKEAWHEKII